MPIVYSPGGVSGGILTLSWPAFADQPIRLAAEAAQPAGRDVIEKLTRSKNVSLLTTENGTRTVFPPSAVGPGPAGVRLNVPSGPMRETSSSGSCVVSGSGATFQLRLPR